jgi:N-hydroxyarylamine O-acetyltransferase
MTSLVGAYLERLGLASAGAPDLDTLRRLHAAHVAAIPFENLDILLGRGISLDLDRLREKLVERKRGGYCFEQNTLFLAVLREVGFTVAAMEARVRSGTTTVRPRTHMVLSVEIDGAPWLVDVGFGGDGIVEPLRVGAESSRSCGLVHRVVEEGGLRVLQLRRGNDWEDQYAFVPEPVYPIDFEMANWFTSTYPQSPFVRTLTAQRTTRDVRYILRYPTFSEIRDSGVETRHMDRGELIHLLRHVFTIDLPPDTAFPAIDGAPQWASL